MSDLRALQEEREYIAGRLRAHVFKAEFIGELRPYYLELSEAITTMIRTRIARIKDGHSKYREKLDAWKALAQANRALYLAAAGDRPDMAAEDSAAAARALLNELGEDNEENA